MNAQATVCFVFVFSVSVTFHAFCLLCVSLFAALALSFHMVYSNKNLSMWLCVRASFSMTVGVLLHIKLRANAVWCWHFQEEICLRHSCHNDDDVYKYIICLNVFICWSLWAHVCACVCVCSLQSLRNAMIVGWVYECVSFLLRARARARAHSYVHIYSHLAAVLSFIFTSKYSLTLTQTQTQAQAQQTNHNYCSLSISNVDNLVHGQKHFSLTLVYSVFVLFFCIENPRHTLLCASYYMYHVPWSFCAFVVSMEKINQ